MADNISIRVTADVSNLTAEIQVAKAQLSGLSSESLKTAKAIVATGDASGEAKARLVELSGQVVAQKDKLSALKTELANSVPVTRSFSAELQQASQFAGAFGISLPAASVLGLATALGALVEKTFEYAEAVTHGAEKTGTSTEEFQRFAQAAIIAGSDTGTITTALERLNVNQAKARDGSFEQLQALEELGLDGTASATQVAIALVNMTDTQERARIATVLMGRSASELVPTFEVLRDRQDDLTAASKDSLDAIAGFQEKLREMGGEAKVVATDALGTLILKTEAFWKWTQKDWKSTPFMIALQSMASAIPGLSLAISGIAAVAGGGSGGDTHPPPRPKPTPYDPNAFLAVTSKYDDDLQKELSLTEKLQGVENQRTIDLAHGNMVAVKSEDELINKLAQELEQVGQKKGKSGDTKGAEQARRIADAQTQAWQQTNLARIAGEQQTNSFLLEMGQETLDAFTAQARKLEDDRYNIELQGLQKREQNDRKDPVAFAKDKADEQVIAQEHVNKLAAIDQQYAQKKRQIGETELQDFIKTEDDELARYLKSTEAQFTAGQISAQDRAKLEEDFTLTIENEVLKRFDAEHAGLTAQNKDYAKIMAQRTAIVDGFSAKFESQEDKLLEAEAEKWKTFASEVRGSFNSALDQLIVHGGTFKQFMISAVQGVESAFLNMGAKIAEDWIENQIRMMLSEDVSVEKFLSDQMVKTTAILEGQSAQVAATAAGSATKSAVEATADSQSILNSAYTAAAKAYTSVMQSVPPPFNLVAAPLAATGVFAAVAAYDVISAEGGLDRVFRDSQPAVLHRDETVLSAGIARPLTRLATSGELTAFLDAVPRSIPAYISDHQRGLDRAGGTSNASSVSSSAISVNLHYSPVIHGGGDNAGLAETLRTHGREMHAWLQNEAQNGNLRKTLMDARR